MHLFEVRYDRDSNLIKILFLDSLNCSIAVWTTPDFEPVNFRIGYGNQKIWYWSGMLELHTGYFAGG